MIHLYFVSWQHCSFIKNYTKCKENTIITPNVKKYGIYQKLTQKSKNDIKYVHGWLRIGASHVNPCE